MRSGGFAGEVREALEREREMRAALVVDHGVDLVHDHGRAVRSISRPPAEVSRM